MKLEAAIIEVLIRLDAKDFFTFEVCLRPLRKNLLEDGDVIAIFNLACFVNVSCLIFAVD